MHDAVLPQERNTGSAGGRKAECREATKVLALRVRTGGLGLAYSLTPHVHAKRHAVLSLESGCAEIRHAAAVPKRGIYGVADLFTPTTRPFRRW